MEKVEKTKQCKECCRDITEDAYNAYDGYCKICYKDKEQDVHLEKNCNAKNKFFKKRICNIYNMCNCIFGFSCIFK